MKIIPALYIKDGKVACYRPGDYEHLEYLNDNPYDLIQSMSDKGVDRILLVDVDASLPGEAKNAGLIGSLSNTTVVDLVVGGGINSIDYLKSLQYAGVDYFVLGSIVIDDFNFLLQINELSHIKNEDIIISLDVKDKHLVCHGWTDDIDHITLNEMIWKSLNAGFNKFIVSEIETEEPNIEFYKDLIQQFPGAYFIASGRINTFEEVKALEATGVKEVIVGDEIYKESHLMDQLVAFNKERS